MNLFWKKLFGDLTSTAKFEASKDTLIDSVQRYNKVEGSEEFEEYQKLYQIIKSADFQEKKKTLQNRKYKDTKYYRDTKKLEKIENKPDIKAYYNVLKSDILKQYTEFKATPEFKDLGDPKKVEQSEQLKKFKHFEHSKDYKTYVRFHDSYIIKELEELRLKVSETEFKKANDFWSDNKRWQKTPEYAQEQRYYQLDKVPDIVFYNSIDKKQLEEYRALILKFEENFEENTLNEKRWSYGFHYKISTLIGEHSFANEKQAYTFGKNTFVQEGVFKLRTRQESVVARAWDESKGFINKKFLFSSDIVQTANSFRQEGGIFQVKLRCFGDIHHAVWLGADDKLPQVNIFHYNGSKITVGNSRVNSIDGTSVKGINPSEFYIYTLKWSKNNLVWSVNNVEVYRTSNNIPAEEMYLAINSFISKSQKAKTGALEIDWIRVYQ